MSFVEATIRVEQQTSVHYLLLKPWLLHFTGRTGQACIAPVQRWHFLELSFRSPAVPFGHSTTIASAAATCSEMTVLSQSSLKPTGPCCAAHGGVLCC